MDGADVMGLVTLWGVFEGSLGFWGGGGLLGAVLFYFH